MASLTTLARDPLKGILTYVVHQGGLAPTSRVCKRWRAINSEIVGSLIQQIFRDAEDRHGLLHHYVLSLRNRALSPAQFFQGMHQKAKQLYGKNFPHKIPPAEAVCAMVEGHEDPALKAAWFAMCSQTDEEAQTIISVSGIRIWMNVNESKLQSVRSLELCHLNLKFLPSEIRYFHSLQWLNLSHNSIARLPPEIGALTSLETLYLQRNALIVLPPEIGFLTALRNLQLHDNRLLILPQEIGRLTSLRYLGLRMNQLFMLPPEMGNLLHLCVLNLSNNRLNSIPPQIGRLDALQFLYLSNNPLRVLPHEIAMLHGLEELWFTAPQLPNMTHPAAPLPLQNLFHY